MKLPILILSLTFTSFESISQSNKPTTAQYREDFNYFWTTINDEYAYFHKKQTDWQKVKDIYSARIDTVSGRSGFVNVLEKTLNEIYDHHAILNTNTPYSNRLVPSGTDTWAEYVNGKPTIVEVRKGLGSRSLRSKAGYGNNCSE